MSKGMCDFMTICEAKMEGLKIHSRRKKSNFVLKKTNKTETWYKKQPRKKYVGIKANQPKNEKKRYLYTDSSNADKKLPNTCLQVISALEGIDLRLICDNMSILSKLENNALNSSTFLIVCSWKKNIEKIWATQLHPANYRN